MENNKILMRIAADMDDDTKNDIDNDIKNDIDNDDFQFDFDSLFNDNDDQPKSDIEKMVTEPLDMDSFDPYQEDETQVNKRINTELISNTFNTLANEGRGLLKRTEDFKFKIIQAINMLNGDPELKTKIEQKKKILESAAAQIYGIVFDLENYDLTPNYEDEQLAGESFPAMDVTTDEDIDLEEDTDEDFDTEEGTEDEMEGGEPSGEEDGLGDLGDLDQGGFDDIPEESEET